MKIKRNRLLSWALTLCMVLCLVPAFGVTAAADEPGVTTLIVGGTEVVTGGAIKTAAGDGWQYADSTLTLNNASIEGAVINSGEAGIYAEGDLDILLVGENTINGQDPAAEAITTAGVFVDGNLSIRTDGNRHGELSVTATTAGAISSGVYSTGDLEIGLQNPGGNTYSLNVKGGNVFDGEDAESYGIYSDGDITINGGGDVWTRGGDVRGGRAISCGMLSYGSITINDGGDVSAFGGKVRGVSATSCGMAGYDNITVYGGDVFCMSGLAEKGVGGDDGNTDPESGIAGFGILSFGDITVYGGEVAGTCRKADEGYGIFSMNGNINVEGGEVYGNGATGGVISGGIKTNRNVTITGGTVSAEGWSTSGGAIGYSFGISCHNLQISGSALTVDAESLNGDNAFSRAIFCSGSVEISAGTVTAIADGGGTPDPDSIPGSSGIYCGGSVNISGGAVTSLGDAEVAGSRGVFIADSDDAITLTGGTLAAGGREAAFNQEPNLSGYAGGYQWRNSPNGAFSLSSVSPYSWSANQSYAEFLPANTAVYDIWIGHRQINALNAADVDGSGAISYNAATKTLSLNDAYILGVPYNYGAGIYATGDLDAIHLTGESDIIGENSPGGGDGAYAAGLFYPDGDLTVTGSGWLNIQTGDYIGDESDDGCSAAILCGDLTVKSGNIWAVGGWLLDFDPDWNPIVEAENRSVGINVDFLTVSGGTVEAIGADNSMASFGIASRTTEIFGGTVNAIGGAGTESVGILSIFTAISGGTVTVTGGSGTEGSQGLETFFGSISGGTLIASCDARATTHSAISDIDISSHSGYQWRTTDSGSYTNGRVTPYTWDSAHTYVEICPLPSSGSSGSASRPETVPVTGDTASLNTTATVKKGIAELDVAAKDLTDISGNVSVDLSGLKEDVTGATLGGGAFGKLAENADSLTVQMTDSSVSLDAAALAAVSEQAGGADVTLSVTEYDKAGLDEDVLALIGEQPVYELSLSAGGKEIHDFGGGKVTVSLPYTLKEGENPENIVIWRMVDGVPQPIPCQYNAAAGMVTFETDSFSLYVVAHFPFADVPMDSWYYADVAYVYQNGLMKGVSDNSFAPEVQVDRAMLVTTLYRLEGEPEVTAANPFSDVAAGQWYTDAVVWAAEKGIVNGYSDGRFDPADPLTREQMAAILYRYEQYKGGGFVGAWMFLLDFEDRDQVSDWAYEPLCWCSMNSIIEGSDGKLLPAAPSSRAQMAAVLKRFTAL